MLSCLFITLISCKNHETKPNVENQELETTEQKIVSKFSNKGHEFVYNMVQNVGNYKTLAKKKRCYLHLYLSHTRRQRRHFN